MRISGVDLLLIAVTKIIKKHFLAHLALFLFSGILSISDISCILVIGYAYEHQILAIEMKNSAKRTLLCFNTTAIFLHDVVVSENDVLEAGQCSWCVCVGNFQLGLSV